jgi:DNA repair protein RadD
MPLRHYQEKLVAQTYASWQAGNRVIIPQAPTGSGKTRMMAHVTNEFNDYATCIAHRRELVGQISMALAESGVRHRLIAPNAVAKWCGQRQARKLGASFVYPNAKVAVAGVDTIIRADHTTQQFIKRCGLWNIDEGHHVLAANKWGTAANMFRPDCQGLAWTATPGRSDGKGLGRHAHGLADDLILGPSMRGLMTDPQGPYLSDYKIIMPPAHIEDMKRGASGEFTKGSVDDAMKKSSIIGQIVPTWLKHAAGLKTVVFAHSVQAGKDICDEFKAAGVRAAFVDGSMSDAERVGLVDRFEAGEFDVLVNVDLFGEGFDLPAIECVIMARPTASKGLYMQQFGRVLRILAGKLYGLVIDHVGNVSRHGLPDAHHEWSLDAKEKRRSESPDDVEQLRTCINVECMAVYERLLKQCPYCERPHVPEQRGGPEFVDGDLYELDGATLARLRGEADRFEMTAAEASAEVRDKHGPPVAQHVAAKRHTQWQQAQTKLRHTIEQWSGYRKAEGLSDDAICRAFYLKFGIDVLSAQGLRKIKDVESLTGRVSKTYTNGY